MAHKSEYISFISSLETALGFYSSELQDSQGGNEELVFLDKQPS